MGKPKAPSAPDPVATSNAQAQANIDTARVQQKLNMINQYTPYGSVEYTPLEQYLRNNGTLPAEPVAPVRTSPGVITPRTLTPQQQAQVDRYMGFIKEGGPNTALYQQKVDAIRGTTGSGTGTGTVSGTASGTGGYTSALTNALKDPYADRYAMKVVLPEESQKALEAEQKLDRQLSELGLAQSGRVSEALNQPFSFDGLPAAPTADEATRQRIQDQLFADFTRRQNPQFDRQRESLRTRLINNGIAEGSEAWNRSFADLEDNINNATQGALTSALQSSGSEMERAYSLGQNARERALQERLTGRQLPLNEAISLISGTQLQAPQFSAPPATQVSGTDVAGNINNAYAQQMAGYNNRVNAQSGMLSSLASLGLSAINPALGWFGTAATAAAKPSYSFGNWIGR